MILTIILLNRQHLSKIHLDGKSKNSGIHPSNNQVMKFQSIYESNYSSVVENLKNRLEFDLK